MNRSLICSSSWVFFFFYYFRETEEFSSSYIFVIPIQFSRNLKSYLVVFFKELGDEFEENISKPKHPYSVPSGAELLYPLLCR